MCDPEAAPAAAGLPSSPAEGGGLPWPESSLLPSLPRRISRKRFSSRSLLVDRGSKSNASMMSLESFRRRVFGIHRKQQ